MLYFILYYLFILNFFTGLYEFIILIVLLCLPSPISFRRVFNIDFFVLFTSTINLCPAQKVQTSGRIVYSRLGDLFIITTLQNRFNRSYFYRSYFYYSYLVFILKHDSGSFLYVSLPYYISIVFSTTNINDLLKSEIMTKIIKVIKGIKGIKEVRISYILKKINERK